MNYNLITINAIKEERFIFLECNSAVVFIDPMFEKYMMFDVHL